MRYLPHTDNEIQEMLQVIGVGSIDELFNKAIPKEQQLTKPLDLPAALAEDPLLTEIHALAALNKKGTLFLGAGAYDHFSPSVIDALIQRGEFLTAYTPYQPEVSQGTLTSIFEFQTLVTQLTGMEVANASLYDGASAAAEACLMASRVTKNRNKFLVPSTVHPQYRQVIETYLEPLHAQIVEIPCQNSGKSDYQALKEATDENTAALLVQSPNFFGVIEEIQEVSDIAHQKGALCIALFSEAISLGLLTPPGKQGADMVCGEGQSLGVPLSCGGPYLGLFSTHEKFLRSIPGRICGETVDQNGDRGYVLTLSTREQHIRRERATSNICTNQGLIALAATIFMSLMGAHGLTRLAEINLAKSEYTKRKLTEIEGVRLKYEASTFNEFVIETPLKGKNVLDALNSHGFIGGANLGAWYPELDHSILVTTTERRTRQEIDHLAIAYETVLKELS